MSTSVRPPAASDRHPVALAGGLVLGLLTLAQLVPTLLAVFLADEPGLAARLANVLLFGGPLVVLLYAAVILVLRGLGRGTGVGVRASSRSGGWALRSVVAVPVLLALAVLAGQLRHWVQPDVVVYGFWGSPEAAVLMVAAWVAGALALVLGAVALLRSRDRSAAVLVAVALGWVVTTFGLGEVLVPH